MTDKLTERIAKLEERTDHILASQARVEDAMLRIEANTQAAFVRGSNRMEELRKRIEAGELSRTKQWLAIILLGAVGGAGGGHLLDKAISFLMS